MDEVVDRPESKSRPNLLNSLIKEYNLEFGKPASKSLIRHGNSLDF